MKKIEELLVKYNEQKEIERAERKRLQDDLMEFTNIVVNWLKSVNRDSVTLGNSNQGMHIKSDGHYSFSGIVSRQQLDLYIGLFEDLLEREIERSKSIVAQSYTSK